MWRGIAAGLWAVCLVAAVPMQAQISPPAAPLPSFDAASIRVTNESDPRGRSFQFLPGGRLAATRTPLVFLITVAYDLPFQSTRLTLAPGVKPPEENYDIEAVGPVDDFPPGISVEARDAKLRLMLQALLADRFHLKIRVESREQPAYALVVGKGGPKLAKSRKTEQECETHGGCHDLSGGQGAGLHGDAVSIADVAQFVQNWTDKPVVDETGLKDLYNVQTEGWTSMRSRPPSPDGSTPRGPDAGANDSDRQTLFEIFEQLGLRMESKPAVVDTYVVESVGKPTEN